MNKKDSIIKINKIILEEINYLSTEPLLEISFTQSLKNIKQGLKTFTSEISGEADEKRQSDLKKLMADLQSLVILLDEFGTNYNELFIKYGDTAKNKVSSDDVNALRDFIVTNVSLLNAILDDINK